MFVHLTAERAHVSWRGLGCVRSAEGSLPSRPPAPWLRVRWLVCGTSQP